MVSWENVLIMSTDHHKRRWNPRLPRRNLQVHSYIQLPPTHTARPSRRPKPLLLSPDIPEPRPHLLSILPLLLHKAPRRNLALPNLLRARHFTLAAPHATHPVRRRHRSRPRCGLRARKPHRRHSLPRRSPGRLRDVCERREGHHK